MISRDAIKRNKVNVLGLALSIFLVLVLPGCSEDKKNVYTVTFDSNGGTEVESQTILHGEKIIRPESPTKEYSVFSGWIDDDKSYWSFDEDIVVGDMTLHAVWDDEYDYDCIVINEICTKNRSYFIDIFGEESDWIELYNSGNGVVNLRGCGLSKSNSNLYRYTFDDCLMEPHSYLIVVASGREEKTFDGECHLPFTFSNNKSGSVFFSSPFSKICSVDFPALKDDISFGLLGEDYETLIPSPGAFNESVYIERQILPPPTFSVPSGFYDDEFDLRLSSSNNYKIYYTIDSGTPDETKTIYSNPIRVYDKTPEDNVVSSIDSISGTNIPYTPTNPVNKCMVVRARCYDDKGNYSPIVSSSYWINQSNFIADNIPVISLNTDFDNLFGRERGIYCNGKIWEEWRYGDYYNPETPYYKQPGNYYQTGFNWEREANLTFFDENHKLQCEQLVGIRIKGNHTRGSPKKSLKVYSRFLYDGNSKFTYKFNNKKCETIALRCGGNFYNTMLADTINSMMAKKCNLEVEVQDTTPTYLFLNGEYWGLYFITDQFDSTFFKEKYNVDDPIVCKNDEITSGYKTDLEYFHRIQKMISSGILSKEGFNVFSKYYSISSLVDIIIFQSYIDTFDYNLFHNNTGFWKSRYAEDSDNKNDGRIRFLLFDTDYSLGARNSFNHYPYLFSDIDKRSTGYLFKSPIFMELMYIRSQDISAILSSEETINDVINYYNKMGELIKQNNLRHFGEEEAGQTEAQETQINFLRNRAPYYLQFVQDKLNNVKNLQIEM